MPGRLADLEPRVMFPKLYGRLVAYFRAGNTDLAGSTSGSAPTRSTATTGS